MDSGSLTVTTVVPAVASLLAAWLVDDSIAVTRETVYWDADPARLTAGSSSGKRVGISSRPANAALINGMVAAIDQFTNKGDPIRVFPDFPAMYFVTDRVNPTRIDWYDPGEIIPSMTQQAVADHQDNEPRLAFMKTFDEADVQRLCRAFDYLDHPKWRPMYLYIREHYRQIGTIGDTAVLVPGTGS